VTVEDVTAPAPVDAPQERPSDNVSFTGLRHALGVLAPFVLVYGLFAVLTVHAAQRLTNGDTYFHLRFGHEFLSGHWSLTDPGSVTTFGTNAWVPTQWLPQVVMAQVEEWWGLAGVAWLSGLLYLSLALGVWAVARRHASPLLAAAITIVAILATQDGMSMRPQVLSYLLIAITANAWLTTSKDHKVRWWLVPVGWLWAMVHGMWPVGIVIGVVALAGIALDRAVPRRVWLRLAAIPLLSIAAAALTPVGPALFAAVLEVNSRGRYFAEWRPPDLREADGIALLLLVGATLIAVARSRVVTPWTQLLLLMLAGGFGLYTERTVSVAAMVLVPVTAMAVQATRGERSPARRGEVLAMVGGAVTSLAVLAVLVPSTANEAPARPDWYADLEAMSADTVVLSDWGEGAYLMWRFPELDFVVSGYGDLYTDAELARNLRLDKASPGWLADVKGTGARYALVRTDSGLAYGLNTLEGWEELERSDEFVLLQAPEDWPATR
jgi:hypothetical protein